MRALTPTQPLRKAGLLLTEMLAQRNTQNTLLTYLEELSSIHKEPGTRIDWVRYSVAMPLPEPLKVGRHEFTARMAHCVAPLSDSLHKSFVALEEAHLLDEQTHKIE